MVEVVRRRMNFWSALAQHSGRACEFTGTSPAVIALAEDDLAAVVDALLGNVFRHTPPVPHAPSQSSATPGGSPWSWTTRASASPTRPPRCAAA
ncbi:hypothetical protein BJF90_27110 [Pseudonocardia sp. CNS-004]|nr:hypothetical protein BJF90_27110 [Pseudonocardia sp. CNS-004]